MVAPVFMQGYKEIEDVTRVFVGRGSVIVFGHPSEGDTAHSCDYMGCSSLEHVLYRADVYQEKIGFGEETEE